MIHPPPHCAMPSSGIDGAALTSAMASVQSRQAAAITCCGGVWDQLPLCSVQRPCQASSSASLTKVRVSSSWPEQLDTTGVPTLGWVLAPTGPTKQTDIDRRYLESDVSTINAIMECKQGCGLRKLEAAQRFKQQHGLAMGTRQENERKGVTPTSALVLRHLSQAQHDEKTHDMDEPVASRIPSTKWMQRFRVKWHLQRSKFGARGQAPLSDLREVNVRECESLCATTE